MDRPLHRVGTDDGRATLVGEQVHGVRSVVPQQVVGPAARLSQRIDIAAAKEIGLHIQLLNVELAGLDFLMHPLVAGIEAPGVTGHRDQATALLQRNHLLRTGQRVSQRNLALHMLAGFQAGDGLRRVHLGRCAQDHRVDLGSGQAVGQIDAGVCDAVLGRNFAGLAQIAADQRDDFDAVDVLDSFDVLDAKSAGTGQRHLDRLAHAWFSRIRWPTAVLLAGTW